MSIGTEPTLRLVDALQKAHKDFDMLCLPNLAVQVTGYTRRRAWDYLVTHLMGIQPPPAFRLIAGDDLLCESAGIMHGATDHSLSLLEKNSIESETQNIECASKTV